MSRSKPLSCPPDGHRSQPLSYNRPRSPEGSRSSPLWFPSSAPEPSDPARPERRTDPTIPSVSSLVLSLLLSPFPHVLTHESVVGFPVRDSRTSRRRLRLLSPLWRLI